MAHEHSHEDQLNIICRTYNFKSHHAQPPIPQAIKAVHFVNPYQMTEQQLCTATQEPECVFEWTSHQQMVPP